MNGMETLFDVKYKFDEIVWIQKIDKKLIEGNARLGVKEREEAEQSVKKNRKQSQSVDQLYATSMNDDTSYRIFKIFGTCTNTSRQGITASDHKLTVKLSMCACVSAFVLK